MTDTISIHAATVADAETLARIHVAGWRAAYAGLVPQDYLDELREVEKAADWRRYFGDEAMTALIAEREGAPAGFVGFGRLRTPPPGSSPIRPQYPAEVYALYLLPEHWRHGVGRALLREAALRLKEKRQTALCLWVMEKNVRANAFYKALGGQRIGKKQVEVGGRMLTEACYGWRDTTALIGLPTA